MPCKLGYRGRTCIEAGSSEHVRLGKNKYPHKKRDTLRKNVRPQKTRWSACFNLRHLFWTPNYAAHRSKPSAQSKLPQHSDSGGGKSGNNDCRVTTVHRWRWYRREERIRINGT